MQEQLREVLKILKWSEYEIDAYATLVEKGAMSPQDLVYEAEIPIGRIYDVLNSLTRRGAVIEDTSRPKTVDAQNPRMVLYGELDNIEKKAERALTSAEQSWERRTSTINHDNSSAWTVKGPRGLITQVRNIMKDAETSLIICDENISWLGKIDHKVIRRLVHAKKDVRILSSSSFAEELENLASLGIKVRMNNKFSSCYIIDKSIVVLKMGNPATGIVIRDKAFVEKTLESFEKDFKASKEVTAKEFVS